MHNQLGVEQHCSYELMYIYNVHAELMLPVLHQAVKRLSKQEYLLKVQF